MPMGGGGGKFGLTPGGGGLIPGGGGGNGGLTPGGGGGPPNIGGGGRRVSGGGGISVMDVYRILGNFRGK